MNANRTICNWNQNLYTPSEEIFTTRTQRERELDRSFPYASLCLNRRKIPPKILPSLMEKRRFGVPTQLCLLTTQRVTIYQYRWKFLRPAGFESHPLRHFAEIPFFSTRLCTVHRGIVHCVWLCLGPLLVFLPPSGLKTNADLYFHADAGTMTSSAGTRVFTETCGQVS